MKPRYRTPLTALLLILSPLTATPLRADPPDKPSADDAKAAMTELADRFEAMSYSTLQGRKLLPPLWRQAAALAKAASRLNPASPRYLRMAIDFRLAGGDSDGAIAALNAYLTLVPDDQTAQVKLINLYVARMQTADSMMNYLRGVVTKTVLPIPVRAHAAVLCAQALFDHAQRDEAMKMLNAALQIEPINSAALHLKYRMSSDEGPSRRVGLLLAMLRSNPIDPEAATALAGELGDLGLPEASASWYLRAAELYNLVGGARSAQLGKGGAAELYLCDHGADGLKLITSYLGSIPYDADAWAIRLSIAKDIGPAAGDYDDLVHQAITDITNRLQMVRSQFGAPNATTRPVQPITLAASTQPSGLPMPEVPDLAGDMTLLIKANQSQLTDTYLAAAGDAAWTRLYFARDAGPDTQRLIDGLARLLPAADPLLARLVGWSYLVQSKWDAARQKLSAVADHDPYAQLGLVFIHDQAGEKADADALARSALAAHPSGAAASVLYCALHPRGATIIPVGQADLVKTALGTFPQHWFDIINRSQEFYSVTAQPLDENAAYTQSVLARITIQNTSDFDITFGEEGTLRPEMIFDASARGLLEKQLPAFAADRFWQRLLLQKGQSASQVVRLDRGELATLLTSRPDVPIDLQFTVTLNPARTQEGFTFGGAGCAVPFGSILERTSCPYDTDTARKKLYDQMNSASAVQRLRTVETLASFGQGLAAATAGPSGSDNAKVAEEMFDHARPASTDKDPAVRAWANYMAAIVCRPEQQGDLVRKLTQSDDWYVRLLGLTAAQHLGDHGTLAASALSLDPDPVVKEYATAITDYYTAAASAAATQPAQNP